MVGFSSHEWIFDYVSKINWIKRLNCSAQKRTLTPTNRLVQIRRLLGEHHCKVIFKNLNNQKIAAWISHAKARRRKDCYFIDFAPSRLCVRLFFILSAHAVSSKSQIGGVHREACRSVFHSTTRILTGPLRQTKGLQKTILLLGFH